MREYLLENKWIPARTGLAGDTQICKYISIYIYICIIYIYLYIQNDVYMNGRYLPIHVIYICVCISFDLYLLSFFSPGCDSDNLFCL